MKKLLLFFISLSISNIVSASEFITRWDMSKPGSHPNQLTFGIGTIGPVSYTWETIPASLSGTGTFNGSSAMITGLPTGSMIRLKIDSTNFNRINIKIGPNRSRLIDVEQWGSVIWDRMDSAFYGCNNLNITSTDIPNLSVVTKMNLMFYECPKLNGPTNINSWNVSNVINMNYLFAYCSIFNQALSNWNTGNGTNMSNMFNGASHFDQPIGNWNTSNVNDMSGMFAGSGVTFSVGAYPHNSFNQPIGNWNTSNVMNMSHMFSNAKFFNQPIGNWNTSNVVNMSSMFSASGNGFSSQIFNTFNQPIGNWDVSNVTNMSNMFFNDTMFNLPLPIWNVQNVTNMSGVFLVATHFNQALTTWNLNPTVNLIDMFSFSGLDCTNYSNMLNAWANNINLPINRTLGANMIAYGTNAVTSRNYLINTKGWNIQNDVANGTACCVVTSSNFSQSSCDTYTFNNQTLTQSGTYYDTLINSSGCDSIITLNLTINNVPTTITQSGATLTANATGVSYQWYQCNPTTLIAGATSQTYTATANGDYAVVLTQNGCIDTAFCVTVTGLGLKNYLQNNISISPNPNKGFVRITSIENLQNVEIKVLSLTGQIMLQKENVTGKQIDLDISSLSNGIYFIEIKTDVQTHRVKVVKE